MLVETKANKGDALDYVLRGKTVVSLPAKLNGCVKPSIKEVKQILAGAGIPVGIDMLAPIKVFRIENKHNGDGMYNCKPYPSLFDCPFYKATYVGQSKPDDKLHPRPEDDSMLRAKMILAGLYAPDFMALIFGNAFTPASQRYVYGFTGIDQMRVWLHDDRILHWLDTHDFVVAECEVNSDSVLTGYSQAMFIKPHEYKTHTIKSFFNL